ncbi:unnamed protein product [Darwinula stevensoni]|uniref:Uncharacterized protein n=1 Tax=Darwinula stevensoni TaxID=69355 RepID=A0A7R9ADY4_9CRUS|nr:unnamed protein product [Darwinula stevensoni]CAG0901785.1 unnamed protein product [Darwinula stevensoni]
MEQDQVNACASLSCPLPSHSGDIRIPVCILDGSNSQQQQEHSQEPSELEPKSLDYCSRKGKFGWHVIGKKALPYVHRNGTEKFCPVRIAEAELLNQFLLNLPPDVINCTSIQSYLITEAEVLLLNEINYRHSKCTFGREPFTTQDLLVSIFDVGEFYEFLQLCHQRLVLQQITACDRCGLIRIGGERGPVVPYTMSKDNVKVIPLIFFEGRIQDLRKTSTFIDGWELVYLRFCCKVLGIRKELYQPKICEVVSLQSVQAEFPIGTLFEEFWPMSVQGALNVKSSAMSTTPPQNSVNIQVAQTQPFSDLTQLPNSLIPSQPSFGTNALNVAQPLTGNTVSEISGGLRSPAAAFPHILNLQTGLSSFVTWPPSVPLQLYKGNTGVALPATKTNHCISSLSSSSSQSVLSQDWRVSAYAIAGNPEHLQNPDQLSGTVALLTGSTAGSNTDRTSVVNQIQPTSLNAVVPGSIGNGRQGAKRTVPAVMEAVSSATKWDAKTLLAQLVPTNAAIPDFPDQDP